MTKWHVNGHNIRCNSVAWYQGTTAAPRYHFSMVPVPSPLWYFLVPQNHKYHGSSTQNLSVVDCSNEHLLDCIVFQLKLQPSASLLLFTAKLHKCTCFAYLFYVVLLYCVYQQEAQLLLRDRATRKHAKDC